MVLTRSSLPPQFLLPAWSPKQLSQAIRRAHKSGSSLGREEHAPSRQIKLHRMRVDGKASLPFKGILASSKIAAQEASVPLRVRKFESRKGNGGHIPQRSLGQEATPTQRPDAAKPLSSSTKWRSERDFEEKNPEAKRLVLNWKGQPRIAHEGEQSLDVAKAFFRWQSEHTSEHNPNPKAPNSSKQIPDIIVPSEPVSTPPIPTAPKPNATREDVLSLFDELFPEEGHMSEKNEEERRKRLFNLPAFNWVPPKEPGHALGEHLKSGKEAWKVLSRSKIPKRHAIKAPYMPIEGAQTRTEESRSPQVSQSKRDPSVLILNACSKTLEESDFFRVGQKGEHIEGWTSGIIKVIPGRDSQTLEPAGHYFILFTSPAAAKAYLDQTNQLHKLNKKMSYSYAHGPVWSPRVGVPPGFVDEEDPETILKGFSLVPGHTQLSLRMINKPYRLAMTRLLRGGDPVSLAREKSPGAELVLLRVESNRISQYDIERALQRDGRRRNLNWKLVGGKDAVVRVNQDFRGYERRIEGDGSEVGESRVHKATQLGLRRYTVAFADKHQARRFVREWHRRPFPLQPGDHPADEPAPIVNAELLW